MDGSYSNDPSGDNVASWIDFAQRPRERGGLGLQAHQAAGVVGNLLQESGPGLNPWGPSGDNGSAWGTAQWRNERLSGLANFSRANGTDPRTREAQQAWMRQELDTTHAPAYAALQQARSPEEAATAFNHLYEVSADRSGQRERNARALYGADQSPMGYSGNTPVAPGVAAINSATRPAPQPQQSPFDRPGGQTFTAGPTVQPQAQSGGMFDDLIAQTKAASTPNPAPQGGMFDDLIAQAKRPPAASNLPNFIQNAPTPQLGAPGGDSFSSSVLHPVSQVATGFNEGLGSTVVRAADAASNLMNKPAEWITGQPAPNPHMLENAFNKHFVEPQGAPQNHAEEVLRAGGHMAGEFAPQAIESAGLAPAVTTGVSAVQELAPGAWNAIKYGVGRLVGGLGEKPLAATAGAFESGAGGETGRSMAEKAGAGPTGQQAAEIAGQFAAPFAMDVYNKGIPLPGTEGKTIPLPNTAGAIRLGAWAGKKAIQAVPEAALPESLRPAAGTYAERQADQLAYSNREGKYANPDEPAPREPNFVQRQMDVGQANREAKARQVVSQELGQILERPEYASSLNEAQRLEQTIPGLNLGVAKSTQDPALLNRQEHIEAGAQGDELRKLQQGYDANVQAVRKYQDSIVPRAEGPRRTPDQMGPQPATNTPQDSVAAANASRVQNTQRANEQEIANTQGLIQRRADALPEIDRAATGQQLREIRHGEQGAADQEVQRLRAGIANPNQHIPELDMTVDQALDRRAAINQEVRRYASANTRTVQDVRDMEALGAERDRIDHALGNINEPGLQEYTRYYREEYAPRFLEGPSREVGRYSQHGIDKNKVQSEDVPSRFFGPNNISEARQFNRLYGTGDEPHSVAARQAMTDYALDDLRHTAVDPNTHMIREGAVNRWMQKNERLLNEMPWIRDAVNARNPDQLYERLGELETRRRSIAGTKVAQLVGKNPEQHIDAALNDWQTMRGLKSSVRGDPQAEAALRRAVMDRAPDPMNADKFEAWLDKNDRSLRQVLDPSHLKALRDVLDASRRIGQLQRPEGTPEVPASMAQKGAEKFGLSIASLLQRVMAVKQGRISPEYATADVTTRALSAFSNREAAAVWKEALTNPKIAQDLRTMVNAPKPTTIQKERMKSYLLSVGLADATGNDK
jgi:hypothetical protein